MPQLFAGMVWIISFSNSLLFHRKNPTDTGETFPLKTNQKEIQITTTLFQKTKPMCMKANACTVLATIYMDVWLRRQKHIICSSELSLMNEEKHALFLLDALDMID